MKIKFEEKFNIKEYNAYRINAVCAKAWFPANETELTTIYDENPEKKKIVIGNGNNIILSKEYYEEEFIILNGCFDKIWVIENRLISAESGATLQQLSEIALQNSFSGLEIFSDIPSSIGGAVVMNAGTKEGEIKDILIRVRYFDLQDMCIKEINVEEIEFEYRNSSFQKNKDKIVLKAWFQLRQGDPNQIKKKMENTKQLRWSKQPREYPNCGSVFKRPSGRFVGPMIDELGMKGFTIGRARISEKHSGFIINIGGATGKDILEVIAEIQRRVKEAFGIDLEVEQRII